MARRSATVLKWLVGGFLLSGIGLVAAVLAVGLYLSRPATKVIGAIPPELPSAVAVEFPSAPGTTVRGWWEPGRVPGGGSVLLLHGVWASRLAMVKRALVLHEQGFGVLLIDLQGHGESSGRRITFGAREGQDVAAAIGFLHRQAPSERVGIIGVSLGGAAALLAPRLPFVSAMVVESVYPTIEAALVHRLEQGLGPLGWIAPVLAPVFSLLMPLVLGVAPDELRPIDHIGSAGVPLLVMAGTLDDRTPIDESRALFERAREPKQFRAVEGAGHVDLEQFGPDAYWSVVLPFLRRTLQPG